MREAVVENVGRVVLAPDKRAAGEPCAYCGRSFEKLDLVKVDGILFLFCDFCRDCATA